MFICTAAPFRASVAPAVRDPAGAPLPAGEIGEIIVSGPMVTEAYDANPGATELAKVRAGGARMRTMRDAAHPCQPRRSRQRIFSFLRSATKSGQRPSPLPVKPPSGWQRTVPDAS